jgi:general secretion pathway protein G
MKNQSRYTKILNNQSGFSLIEIMIVVMIMGILIGLVGPKVMSSFSRAKVDTTKVQMKQIATTLKNYRLDCNLYPSTDQGLDALTKAPTTGNTCRNYAPGGYMNKLPRDAWDKDFLYESTDGTTFAIKSLGADMKEGGVDYDADIVVTDQD